MRIMTVSQLINELIALKTPAAQVNVTVRVGEYSGFHEYDGPVELVEKVFLPEGPAVRLIANNGSEL